jgi:hypothetical protein
MKRLLVLLTVCALCAAMPMIALAKAPPPTIVGVWAMSGKVTISASFPNIATLTLTLPNVAILGDELTFFVGEFTDELLGMTGTYTQTSTGAYTVDISDWVSSFEAELAALLAGYGIDASVTVTKDTFTGKATSATKCTANLSMVLKVTAPITGQITITGTWTGKRVTGASEKPYVVRPTPQSLANELVESWNSGLLFQKLFALPPSN